jgi:hypothetical protein
MREVTDLSKKVMREVTEGMRNFLNFLLIPQILLSSKMFVPCAEVLFLTCPNIFILQSLFLFGKRNLLGSCHNILYTYVPN